MKLVLRLALLGLATLTGAFPANDNVPDTAGPAQTADCRANAPAGKRGVAYNNAQFTRFFSTNGKVSWMYNWDSRSPDDTPNTGFDYIPLLWSDEADLTSHWEANIDRNVNIFCGHYAMSFNEPDNCRGNTGGSCMDLGRSAAAFNQWMQPLAGYGDRIKLGAPAIMNSDEGGKGLDYLTAFLNACIGCKIDFIAIHWYADVVAVDYFKQYMQKAYQAGGNRPLWLTEFAPTTGSEQDKINFLKQVLPWMDSQDYIHRYAYTMAEEGTLIASGGGTLSALGIAYATI